MSTAGVHGVPAGPGAAGLRRDPLRVLLAAGVGAAVVLHAHMALAGIHGAGWSVLMGAMAAVCLFCVIGMLRDEEPAAAMRMSTGMALAMALAHVLALPLLGGGGGHHGTSSAAGGAAQAGHGAMLLVVLVELAVAAGAVAWIRRHERRSTYRSV